MKAYVHIEDWRNRPLQGGRYPYVYVDGIYLRRNWGGEYENVAVLVAIAVNEDGYREVLGAAEGMKEDKASWVSFFFDAGLCQATPCSWHPVGQQEVHEYEALRGYPGGCLYCWLILFCQSLQTILRIILDITSNPIARFTAKANATYLLRHHAPFSGLDSLEYYDAKEALVYCAMTLT